jgi:hypothetical protein
MNHRTDQDKVEFMADLANQRFWKAVQDLMDFYEKHDDEEYVPINGKGKPMQELEYMQWYGNTERGLWARLEKLANVASHKVHPAGQNTRAEKEAAKERLETVRHAVPGAMEELKRKREERKAARSQQSA